MIAVAQILLYMARKPAPPTVVLARIALRQHGVVSRQQILALGLDRSFITRGLAAGRLHRIHAGVYAVGHTNLTPRGRWMAAVLAGGESALLSHRDAAALTGLADIRHRGTEISVPGRSRHRRPGLVIHSTRDLPDDHRTVREGIPVTSPHRTLLDLASILTPRQLRFAVEAADRPGPLDVPSLVAMCDASPGRRGTGTLKCLALEQRGPIARTKSPPERLFLRLCIKRGLPMPLVNSRLEGYEVDFHWPDARLVVEIDSYTYHRSWPQRQRDIARDAHLKTCGHDVLRYVEGQLLRDEDGVFAQIGFLLAP